MKSIDLMDLFLQINKAEQNLNYLQKEIQNIQHTLRDMNEDSEYLSLQAHSAHLSHLHDKLEIIRFNNRPF